MSGAHKITTRAVVLDNHRAGEGNSRIDFYTEHLGLIRALGTSAREERSQLRAHLQEGSVGSYTFVKGKNNWRVTGAFQTRNVYFGSATNPPALRSASRIVGIVRQLIRGEGHDEKLFASLWGFFLTLPSLREEESQDAECLAVLRTLSSLGYVEDAPDVRYFLGSEYDSARLIRTRDARSRLVKIINEGIAVSGL